MKEHDSLNILFVQEEACMRNYKMAKALRSKGINVSLAHAYKGKQYKLDVINEIFYEIAKTGIHIHVYPMCHDINYEKAFSNHPYIHYHQPVSPHNIVQEMTQYDFGLIPFVKTEENYRHIDMAVPHKLYEYLAAGLPVISYELTVLKQIIERDKIGIVYKDSGDIVRSIDTLRKIKLPENRMTYEDQIDKLIDIYELVLSKNGRRDN